MSDPGSELVEVLDEAGRVEGVVTRAEMRAGNLRHRASFVVVVSLDRARVLVHRRADWKDVWPGAWDLAFGGVAGVAESEAVTAVRELYEELGLDVAPNDLQTVGVGRYDGPEVRVIGNVWLVVSDGPFELERNEVTSTDRMSGTGEVVEVEWLELADLDGWLHGHEVCPDTVSIVVPLLRGLPD